MAKVQKKCMRDWSDTDLLTKIFGGCAAYKTINPDRFDALHEYSRRYISRESEKSAQILCSEKAAQINLSMPESVEYFEAQMNKLRQIHEDMKSGKIARSHSYSLTYAKKAANEAEKNYKLALKLWA